MDDPKPYIDTDGATLIWVPDDPRNRHYQLAKAGLLAAVDPETGEPFPEELERAQAARARVAD